MKIEVLRVIVKFDDDGFSHDRMVDQKLSILSLYSWSQPLQEYNVTRQGKGEVVWGISHIIMPGLVATSLRK